MSPSALGVSGSGSAAEGAAGKSPHDTAALPQLHHALEQARQAYRQQYQQLHDVRTEERRLRSEVRAHTRRPITACRLDDSMLTIPLL